MEADPQARILDRDDALRIQAQPPRVGELILAERGRERVVPDLAVVKRRARVTGEPLRAEVRLGRERLGRRQVRELRGRRRARSLPEQLAYVGLGDVVVALAEMCVADVAVPVDEVLRRPVLVPERRPRAVLAVERDRVADAQPLDRAADVRGHRLERELGRVDANDHEPVLAVHAVPRLDVRERAQAVDARVGPEVDQHDLAAQLLDRQGRAVHPAGDPGEVGGRPVVGQRSGRCRCPGKLPVGHVLPTLVGVPAGGACLGVLLEEPRVVRQPCL